MTAPAVLAVGACEEPPDLTLPTAEEVASYYGDVVGLEEADISGNVAVVAVRQPPEQLRRGGSIWAKVGPYIYLFSEETRALMGDHPGLAAVRMVTRTASGVTVASALLARDELTDVLWRRSLNVSGLARRDGSERVTLLEDLIEWGEDHTDFEYNARFVPRR
jgi:hypothetical protein